MTLIKYIDVFPFAQTQAGLRFLLLRRASANSYPGIWQPVAGKVKPGETAGEAGLREFKEETGFTPLHFYALDHVSSYYLHVSDEIIHVPAFMAEVRVQNPKLSHEHDAFTWLTSEDAISTASWAPYKVALDKIPKLLDSSPALALAKILLKSP
ncbi:MAG: NUDIX domain-containing protein [Candidatus Marinimicrobia bacterium]|nr:NUDIX domain-containing protein [Candidatus Neomarinimicrobiota bacterium]